VGLGNAVSGHSAFPARSTGSERELSRFHVLLRRMSPSFRLELTRVFFKLGAPDRMTAQRDAADFQTVGTVARIESRTRA
jgi:hypothetical protein